jgi:hypothetical protein
MQRGSRLSDRAGVEGVGEFCAHMSNRPIDLDLPAPDTSSFRIWNPFRQTELLHSRNLVIAAAMVSRIGSC